MCQWDSYLPSFKFISPFGQSTLLSIVVHAVVLVPSVGLGLDLDVLHLVVLLLLAGLLLDCIWFSCFPCHSISFCMPQWLHRLSWYSYICDVRPSVPQRYSSSASTWSVRTLYYRVNHNHDYVLYYHGELVYIIFSRHNLVYVIYNNCITQLLV